MLQPILYKCCCSRSLTPRMNISTTVHLYGGVKVKRRKQEMRVDNPHLPTVNRDNRPTVIAVQNLDQHYGEYYKKRWNSMRLALLSRPKFCVVVNNFAEKEEAVELLKAEGCINIGDKFRENQKKYDALSDASSDSKTVKPQEEVEIIEKAEETSTRKTKAKAGSEDDEDESEEDLLAKMSLNVKDAKDRYIDPEERIVGDMSTAIYDFMPTSTLKGMEDFVEVSEYYSYYKTKGLDSVNIESYPRLTFPKNLDAFMHPRNILDLFPAPKVDLTTNMNYYCMDGGSLLPVIALDLAPGDSVLDMCAGPGGKSLVAMQTLLPGQLVCNEMNAMRLKRLTSIFDQYFGRDSGLVNIKDLVKYSKRPAQELYDYGVYDKVICDVPCFSDRHSLNKNNADNVFTQKMIKNRLLLPEQQCELLKAGLQYLKPGGVLVYSTCTLSPVQNEGVVNMALKGMAEETTMEFAVSDLTEAVKPLGFIGRIYGKHQGVTLGNLVVPNLCNNFGPTYFCRITRKS